jgi:hypothetical protein
MPGTGRDFGCVNSEAARWRLAALLTPRSDALNLGGFGATIRQILLPKVAVCCTIGLYRRFLCWRLPTVSACCALGGVRSGVNDYSIRQKISFCTLPISCGRASALAKA